MLMGQRQSGAVFMPKKVVFPGGAVDAGDQDLPLIGPIDPETEALLQTDSACPAAALLAAAVRELWEETGLMLGAPGQWKGPCPPDWAAFGQAGVLPDVRPLRFVCRAVTPPGEPRRFDARFILADAAALSGSLDDFSRAGGELSDLRWVPLDETDDLDLALITRIVLAEVRRRMAGRAPMGVVPFFHSDGDTRLLSWLGR